MSNKAVAIVGMCGSGKSVLTEMFENCGWQKVYFGGVTVSQLQKEGLAVNEANERAKREQLRQKYGQAAFAVLLEDEIRAKLQISDTVLDGLYSWSEYKYLREKFGDALVVLAVVADKQTRYGRLENRSVRPLSAEQASSRDFAEIENLEKGGPIAAADYYVINNGSKEQLSQQFKQFLAQLRHE